MTYVIAEPCIDLKDLSCVEVRPVDCIHPTQDEPGFRRRGAAVHRSRGAHRLRRVRGGLPVGACFAEDQLPDDWQQYIQINADYYYKR